MANKPKVIHGGNILSVAQRLGCAVEELTDMSSNLTPLGKVPGLREAIIERLDEISFLPETGSETLRSCFVEKYGLKDDQLLVGNGTTEFIFGVPAALAPERAIIVNPTYSDYHLACEWASVAIENFTLQRRDNFVIDFDQLAARLSGNELVFICNSNNPTGVLTKSAFLHEFIKTHKNTMFMIDESYLPFVREPSLLEFDFLDNLLVLNSFSKIYGIPGLRLGFLAASRQNMARLGEQRKPWGVNRIAQIAGEFLCHQADGYVEDVISFLEKERPLFVEQLSSLPGVEVIPGVANFILCCLTGEIRAPFVQEKMLAKGIMIRNCDNFSGLDDRYFRISMKSREINNRCVEVLREILTP
ncbi:MAG: aminotransferase class I/II-fold pyridoxal phosphate-dependent enzyme [Proteobacteria bacterium]|nr:aminotransferase class I/II-fold pyridoxal phosphate-dependent enzyme [Pseudomonadota bacterium]MBU1717313.1 aminotransferase class I/II-fold pyridoxal phosphate-dependent enzyme [Pseudomonadota bacterium]